MPGDVRLLVRLRARHARAAVERIVHGVGTDLADDRDLGDRVYQVYAAIAVGVAVALVWAALLDMVEEAFAASGAALAAGAPAVLLLVLVTVLAFMGVRGLRTSMLKLSHPDISFVASTAIASRALVGVAAASAMLAAAAAGAVGGYLLGVGLAAALGPVASAPLVSLACVFCAAASMGGAWVAGTARLAAGRGRTRRRNIALAALGLAAAVVAGALFAGFFSPSLLSSAPGWGALCLAALAIVVLEAFALALLGSRVDMVAVVQESALAADLDPFGLFSPLDPAVQDDYRRRMKLARRGPRFSLPTAQGRAALVARAAVSMLRQREGYVNLLGLGLGATPLGVYALLNGEEPVMLLFWLMALVLILPQGPHEATRAFRDDMRVRLVRDRLPFGTLELLVLDTLPAFVVVSALSCAAVLFVVPAGASLAVALGLAVLINATVLLSCGLEAVRMYPGGPRPWKEAGMIALVAVTGALALFHVAVPWLLIGAAAVGVSVARIVRDGVECER